MNTVTSSFGSKRNELWLLGVSRLTWLHRICWPIQAADLNLESITDRLHQAPREWKWSEKLSESSWLAA